MLASLRDRIATRQQNRGPVDQSSQPAPTDQDYGNPPPLVRSRPAEPVNPLGTREDVQADDYQSPIANMFGRAWGRYRTAEEVRQAERAIMNSAAPEFASVDTSQLTAYHQPLPTRPAGSDFNVPIWGQSTNSDYTPTVYPGSNPYPTPFFRGASSSDSGHVANRHGNSSGAYPHASHNTSSMFANPFARPPPNDSALTQMLMEVDLSFDGVGPNDVDLQQRPKALEEKDKLANIECKVCGEQKVDTLTEPCMHIALCRWCAEIWERQARQNRLSGMISARNRCVICRAIVRGTRRVHLA
jgi:hypothetical protein